MKMVLPRLASSWEGAAEPETQIAMLEPVASAELRVSGPSSFVRERREWEILMIPCASRGPPACGGSA